MNKQNEKKTSKKGKIFRIIFLILVVGYIAFAVVASIMDSHNGTSQGSIWESFSVFGWFSENWQMLVHAAIYILNTLIVLAVVGFIGRKVVGKTKKAKTLIPIFNSFLRYAGAIVVLMVALASFGVDAAALIASAGVLTLVVGLGAQSLIQDILAGFFIIFESEFDVGDMIMLGDFRGEVTNIGLRTTSIQDAGGNIKTVNNSSIREVINMSSSLSVALCTVGIAYGEDIARVEKIIADNIKEISTKIENTEEQVVYLGVSSLGDSAVGMLFKCACKEENRLAVERGMNKEIKMLFDREGVEIPFPQVVVHQADK